jgi:hypothetical protein
MFKGIGVAVEFNPQPTNATAPTSEVDTNETPRAETETVIGTDIPLIGFLTPKNRHGKP